MDWFERLTGFREGAYAATQDKLKVEEGQLKSLVNGKSYGVGQLELVPLTSLRERVNAAEVPSGRMKVSVVRGNVRAMHQLPENAGALFQVASQFNLLEMVSPAVTPEHGVTRYQHDPTQGPACAIAAGAATIYRNYFVPVGDRLGQTKEHQLDGLAQLGRALSEALGQPIQTLWSMENGYAMCSRSGLDLISNYLATLQHDKTEALMGMLCIGVHSDVEVTDANELVRPKVSQAFCSALPVAYGRADLSTHWTSFAKLILQAAYEATMWAAVLNAQRGASRVVLLTRLGGGAFGNDDAWIQEAILRALRKAKEYDLHVKLVSYGEPSQAMLSIVAEFA